ncbi:MAG TPA: hypothetical protein VL443_22175 [Cyclobacteriaceae bacterium]|nr:hypothetical protein [Cyclobacteriaceae bacterium]
MKIKVFALAVGLLSILSFKNTSAQQVQPEQPVAPAEQPKPKSTANTIDELKLKLNDDGSHFIKATFSNQVWFRFNDSNPGTMSLGEKANQTFDIGLRRTRVQLYGQLTDHVTFYFQFGQNNFNYLSGQTAANNGNRKFQVFFHDALTEYRVKKGSDLLFIGGGLTIANGLSRFSQPSISTIMSLDVPVFAQATVDQTDQFSRKLSAYLRGQLGRLDYRLVLSDPFPVTSNGSAAPALSTTNATFATIGHHKQYQGLFLWNFFDKESHTTPYMTGTYLGKKKVLNLEAGFITQKNATMTGDGIAAPKFYDMNLWSVAVFYDTPLNQEKGTALNAYAGYFSTDYGQNYLRYNGTMNPATAGTAGTTPLATVGNPANGGAFGNAFPMFGTGQVIYAQAGYLLKKDLLGEGNGTLMPYVTLQSAKYDRLDKQMNVYDVGINWLIKGHTSKISLDYQNRPVYGPGAGNELVRSSTRKSSVVLQYQIFF